MMTDQSQLFDKNQASGEGAQQQPTADKENNANLDKGKEQSNAVDLNAVYADQLSAITGEDGQPKYKDVNTALYALKASQEFIETLKAENSQYKEKAGKAETLEQMVESFKNSQGSNLGDQPTEGLAVEDIEKIVTKTISQRETETLAVSNQTKVVETLQQVFGDKAEEKYVAKAQELGLPVEQLDSLSSMSPSAVLKYFEADMKKSKVPDKNINGSVNTETFANNQQPAERKNIMYGASTADMLTAWRQSAAKIEQ